MWEMQQLGRRAGALNIDLMSKQPGKQKWRISLEYKLLSSLLGVVLELMLVLLAPTGTISGIAYTRK